MLRRSFPHETFAQLSARLPGRSSLAVQRRARLLGLRRQRSGKIEVKIRMTIELADRVQCRARRAGLSGAAWLRNIVAWALEGDGPCT
ncbi:hypothetical protein [Ancylobacter amanitiformis]|uniref:CopG family transcriptional regulator n=1 Tax=Ancylobacter amanitiformis TaxID=217069 RepID=A0ABU0LQE2_9HYPH|nr:hypothetical protein [Ancylobacter amanitiformis]MDQ0510917.1 hypothetical protein [Ancylobacter amanitiformis]